MDATASVMVICLVCCPPVAAIFRVCFAKEKYLSIDDFRLCSTAMLHKVQNSLPQLSCRISGNCTARSLVVIFVGKCETFVRTCLHVQNQKEGSEFGDVARRTAVIGETRGKLRRLVKFTERLQ